MLCKMKNFGNKRNAAKISIIIPVSPTEKLDSIFNRFWKSGHLLNVVPFHFNTSTNTLVPSPYIPHRIIWSIFMILYLLDLFYMSQIRHKVTLDKVSEDEFVNFYVHFITRVVASIFLLHLSLNRHEFSQFSHFLALMIKKCEFQNFEAKRFIHFLQASVFFAHIQPLFPLILHLQSRHSARYWPSQFIKNEIYDSFFVASGYAILDLNYSFMAIWGSLFSIIPVMCYNFFGQHWMQKLG